MAVKCFQLMLVNNNSKLNENWLMECKVWDLRQLKFSVGKNLMWYHWDFLTVIISIVEGLK